MRLINEKGGRQMGELKKLTYSNPEIRLKAIWRVVQVVGVIIYMGLLLIISAGNPKWLYAWLYLASYSLMGIIALFFIPPEELAERASKKENVEKWDKVWIKFYFLASSSILVVSGLDFRWGWSPELSTWWYIGSFVILILGIMLTLWAMSSNVFYSTAVRIQFDRRHTVCSSGPYKYIRHPGYLGNSLFHLSQTIFLGSFWALIPAFITIGLLVMRTSLEERTLLQKLPGYKEYANRVRFRLIPGIW
jgi:protein-S-isoprenylcysteine O-methyltransferase Ste14